jgi:hypothetical protein
VEKRKSDNALCSAEAIHVNVQYLSKESLEEVKRNKNWDMIDQTLDPEALWQVIEEKHKLYTISEVEIVTKMAARSTYQQMCQGH